MLRIVTFTKNGMDCGVAGVPVALELLSSPSFTLIGLVWKRVVGVNMYGCRCSDICIVC